MIHCCTGTHALPRATRWLYAIGLLPLAAGCVLLYAFDPSRGGYPVCPFYTLTGYYCPGCGSLRALHQLFRGDVVAAFEYNVLTVLFAPVLAYAVISLTLAALRGRGLPKVFVPAPLIWALFTLINVYWFARNLPLGVLPWLAPGA